MNTIDFIKFKILIVIITILVNIEQVQLKSNHNVVIDNVADLKDFKKLLRTKTNMLVMFISSEKEAQSNIKVFRDSAEAIKGLGTMLLVDCSNKDKKKLCKKLKVLPEPFILKHYKDGDFHKDYDRQMIVASMVNFMRDPTGDLPWEEDPKGVNVLHITDANQLNKILKKEIKPMMIMFYAPWCGYCKQLKPEYGLAATELKNKYVMAAIDVDRPENSISRRTYNISGFPTLIYFENGERKYTYEGENKKDALIAFMENPTAPPIAKAKEDDWSADTTSEIVHLTTAGFEPALKDEKSVLVMFYAPWCGHCKKMKPDYEKAAIKMKNEKISGILAALDATKESTIAQKYGVKGYPTVKYFVNGEFKFDVNVRDTEKIVSFMKDPKEPPPPPPPEKPWSEEESEVEHLNDETFKPFLKKKKHALVMFYAPWCGHCKKAKPEFTQAADAFKDDPRVALAAVDCTLHSAVCSVYEVRGYPTIKYFSYLKTVIDFTGGRTANDFINFLKNPIDLNSNTMPNSYGQYPGSENLITLTEANFYDVTRRSNRILVFFYAPWCGHCKSIKPHFADAAKKSGGNVRFGAVDSDANKRLLHNLGISHVPAIVLYKSGSPQPQYSGEHRAQNYLRYIANALRDEL